MKRTILIIAALLSLVLSGCSEEVDLQEGPDESSYSLKDSCETGRGSVVFSGSHLPKNITVNNQTIIVDFSTLIVDKFHIFNLSDKVESLANETITFQMFDSEGYLIYGSDEYTSCGWSTINRLIELNATDILYDTCVRYPRITLVEVYGNYYNTDTTVCWE